VGYDFSLEKKYDLNFGYECNLFESLNPVYQTAGKKISSLHGCSRRIRPFQQQGMHRKDR